MSKVIELKETNLKDVIGEGVALVELGSVTCGPCKMLEPILDKMSEKVNFPIVKVEVYDFPEIATEYKVRSIPVLLVFKNGEVVNQLKGFVEEKEIVKAVKKYL